MNRRCGAPINGWRNGGAGRWRKWPWRGSYLNKYDLEHALTPHPNMSKAEWERLYRDAWAIYYTPQHIETILRRAQAYGINILRLAQIIRGSPPRSRSRRCIRCKAEFCG